MAELTKEREMDIAITGRDSDSDPRSRTDIAVAEGRTPAPEGIIGWGVDADPRNDPTYPIRHRERDPGLTKNWERPPSQQTDVEILQSIEHIRRPAVVGTSTPPSGVSGMIRRLAFRWSESNWLHWLLLLGADRVNMVEGIVEDLGHGKIPNIPAEMGIRAEWKHNKQGLAKKVGVTLAIGGIAWALLRSRRSGGESKQDRLESGRG